MSDDVVHYYSRTGTEPTPPCGTPDRDFGKWSTSWDDVTCEECLAKHVIEHVKKPQGSILDQLGEAFGTVRVHKGRPDQEGDDEYYRRIKALIKHKGGM